MLGRMIALGCLLLTPVQASSPARAQVRSAPDWTRAETFTITLSNFRFTPDSIRLKSGQAYDLRLENKASGGHDFAARAFFASARIMDGDAGKVVGGKIAVDGGQSVDVHLVAGQAGTYKLRCTHFLHSSFGMTGDIVVQ